MIKTVDDYNFKGKRAIVRVDFNVPFDENMNITDDIRIVYSLPTIDKIIKDGGIPILISHLGRPKGERNPKYSLKPVADYLIDHGYKTHFVNDCMGDIVLKVVETAKVGEVVLLENLRYYKEEEANDYNFALALSKYGEVYVNNAFGAAHRAHASISTLASMFPDRLSGYLIRDELKYLNDALSKPQKPFVAVIGGAKISGKIDVINNFLDKCDYILIGGGMVFTFYKAMGFDIGNSILEADRVEMAKELLDKAKEKGVNLILPTDVIIANEFTDDTDISNCDYDKIPKGKIGMDIGVHSKARFYDIIKTAKTVLWNGPMGVFEIDKFAHGTFEVAMAIAEATANGAETIVGGGDSCAAIKHFGFEKRVSHVSTGGGASLEYLEGKILPGIAALEV